jgi:two-component system, NarL family, invasion response regulator UvrY
MIRIIIVDDHTVVREGLKRILGDDPEMIVSGEAASAEDAMDVLGSGEFDVAVVDMNLPGRSGLQLLADIKRNWPALRVLILSFYAEDVYAVRAIRAGADGFITKDSGTRVLVGAIQRVAAGERFVTSSVAELLASTAADGDSHQRLSARENEVMQLLVSGLSASDIARRLGLSVKTVSTYRARILEKTGLQTNAQLIRYAMEKHLLD